ncbi:hypothetical protein FE697_009650 [Mumia zhuanghuii]|uniref:4 TMS phage holin, superfamily IV n=2 Tax=Mumia TaxID=1546255 RepID=A0ABW1QRY2_9ACTN|nr:MULTISPECIES: hypothetical protein [Mumia]KAA1423817.1 hypothetical protein FE697_009650 [Mumia zhuanghuii]
MTTESSTRRPVKVTRALIAVVLLTAVACVAGSALVAGGPGVVGALIGLVLVAFLLGFTAVALRVLARPANGATLLIALLLYATNVMFVVAVALALTRSGVLGDAVHSGALGITVLVGALVGTVLFLVAAVTTREPLYDLGGER